MNRIGFDQKQHPRQIQLRFCSLLDLQGLKNRASVTIDLQEGTITNYFTSDEGTSTRIKKYVACDSEIKELYEFFTMNNIQKFKDMSEGDKQLFNTGYHDEAILRYVLITCDGRVLDGVRYHIYSNDPVEQVLKWMGKILPYDLIF